VFSSIDNATTASSAQLARNTEHDGDGAGRLQTEGQSTLSDTTR